MVIVVCRFVFLDCCLVMVGVSLFFLDFYLLLVCCSKLKPQRHKT